MGQVHPCPRAGAGNPTRYDLMFAARNMIFAGLSRSAAYRAAVLADSPTSYWRLGETSGTTAADEIGANAGSYVASPTLGASGIFPGNPAVTLNGSTQYASAGTIAIPGAITLESWVKVTSAAALQMTVSNYNAAGSTAFYLSVFGGLARGFIGSNPASSKKVSNSSSSIPLSQWVHIVATWDGGSTSAALIYVNGALNTATESNDTFSSVAATGLQTIIGARHNGAGKSAYLSGSLDEVAIYPTALSAARVLAHYNAAGYP
jgi:hypothetical protein